MRLVPKLTIVLMAASGLLLSARGWQGVQHDATMFELDMQRDHRVVGHALGPSLAEVLQSQGAVGAQRMLETANAAAGGIQFAWCPAEDRIRAPFSTADVARVLAGEEIQRLEPSGLVSLFPVRTDHVAGVLGVTESLEERDRYVRSAASQNFVSIAVVLALFGALALLLSGQLVGGPVQLLVEKARRVGKGDLSEPLHLRRSDEFGELASELNAMCEALAQANARASAEMSGRLAALEQLRHADRLATVGKLAAGLAHELGTPLSIVSGHAEMIANGEVRADKSVASAQIIDREAKRIARIVRQLLDFARRKGPEGGSTDIAEAARHCIALFEPTTKTRQIQLGLDPTPSLSATIDPDSLQQITANLVANAIDAIASKGTIRLRLSTENATAKEGRHPGEYVRLDVIDDGAGIAPEVLPHIFEPFFSTKEPGDGTGLGLSVVFGIVQDHGGWISVDTQQKQGTTFSVFLPKSIPS